jgi:hypothetical protein
MADDDDLWLSLTDVAARYGVTKAAISKRVKAFVAAGSLTTRPGPGGKVLVNIVAYDRLVKAETDPAQALRNGTVPAAEPADDTMSGKGGFHQHRAARESYQAENARLDLEERLGRLVDKEDVGRLTADIFRRFRDRMLSLPARLADRLAALPDAAAIRSRLNEEIRRELDHFAQHLDTMDADALDADAELTDDGLAGELAGDQHPPHPA